MSEHYEPNDPRQVDPNDPQLSDAEERAVLAAVSVLEAGDPERALDEILAMGAAPAAEEAEADVTLRRLYVETFGLLGWEAPEEQPPDRVRTRLMATIAGSSAGTPTAPAEAPAETAPAPVVPIGNGRRAGGAPPAPQRASSRFAPWLATLAAVFAAAAIGVAGWFYGELHETQDALARLESERTSLAERLDQQETLIRRRAGMDDFLTAVSTAGVEVCPLRPVGDPALHPQAFAILYMPPGSGEWYLLATNLRPGDGVYKVWLNTPDGPVPVGFLEPGDESALEIELPPDIDQRHELMLSIVVTLEPAPDMPDPQGPMVLFGDEKMKIL